MSDFTSLHKKQGTRSSPRKRNAQREKGYLRKVLQIAERREVKGKGEKKKYNHLNAEFQREIRKPS